jgi:hypothetical protein
MDFLGDSQQLLLVLLLRLFHLRAGFPGTGLLCRQSRLFLGTGSARRLIKGLLGQFAALIRLGFSTSQGR